MLWRHWMVGQLDASIVAGALLAIVLLARHQLSPRVRSLLLLIALARLALPPWLRSPWSEALVDAPLLDATRAAAATLLDRDFAVAAFWVTTSISIVLLIRLASALRAAERRWAETTTPAPAWLQALLVRPTRGVVEVRLSESGEGPLAVGLRRRLIVLPASAVAELDGPALEAVLAHELAHHERRDLLWIAAASALSAVAWFNPLAHVMARALVATREDGSDDWAVSRTSNDPFTYAHALLKSARMAAVPHPLGVAGAHPMSGRLKRLLDHQATREGRLGIAGTAVVVLAATLALPAAHMSDPGGDSTAQQIVIVIRR
jgi:beta-lactamase regulating signal transducer with metallopeptidase domain